MDNKILAVAVVGAGVVASAAAFSILKSSPPPATVGKEQCYGVAKAGENGCAATNGSHTCGGLSTLDNSGQEWMLVESGTCLKMGGQMAAYDDPKPAPTKESGT